MNAKILYIEDDPFLSRIVSDGLKSSGYDVRLINDGKFAIEAFESARPDICIFDIMLPSKDGYEIAQEIRKIDQKLPIIFLSAKTLTEDVVKGFKIGGNDYLKKPCSMDELLVRIEALLNRFNIQNDLPAGTGVLCFGKCKLNTVNQELTTSNGRQLLSFKESALLELLIIHKNNILKRQDALAQIWQDETFYNTRSMDVFMANLRKYLKDEPGIQIMNLRGIGYKLIC